MARWTLQPKGAAAPINLELEGDSRGFALLVEGRRLEGSVESSTPGGPGLLRSGTVVHRYYSARVQDELHLWVDGETYLFTIPGVGGRAPRAGTGMPAGGEVPAPMPGQVLKVLVAVGDQVDEHAPLVVIESMKMELTVPAPAAGRVREVRCCAGQMVDLGAVLLTLESTP